MLRASVLVLVIAGALLSSTAWAQCTSNADCKGGRACQAGACVDASCSKDTDCPGNQICRAAKCTMPAGAASAGTVRLQTRTVKESITWLWVTGLVVWGLDYLTGIGVAAGTSCDSERGKALGVMLIPIAGPFVLKGVNECPLADDYAAPLIVAGVFQIIAAAAFVAGLVLKRDVQVPVLSLGEGPRAAKLRFQPGLVSRDGFGLNVSFTHF